MQFEVVIFSSSLYKNPFDIIYTPDTLKIRRATPLNYRL